LSAWQTNGSDLLGSIFNDWGTFCIYVPWGEHLNPTSGTEDYLWLEGFKPSGAFVSPDVSSKDGFTVWTTAALDAGGVGIILRWRVRGSNAPGGQNGAWRSPGAGWTVDVPPSSDGVPHTSRKVLDEFNNGAGFYYDAELEWRYVLTKPYSMLVQPLDEISNLDFVELVTLRPRPASLPQGSLTVLQRVNFRIMPTATCTTPSVVEGTVYFDGVGRNNFPSTQWGEGAYRDFTLTFSDCPRVNVKYYIHANGTRWVGGVEQSVVGVNDSIPGDSNPISGNPRGYGIQLEHRNTGNHQHTGTIYIHPNEVANPLALPDVGGNRQAYTRNWHGLGAVNSPTGVTHTIPMRARLLRTGDSSQQTIQPGTFNTSLIVVIAYP